MSEKTVKALAVLARAPKGMTAKWFANDYFAGQDILNKVGSVWGNSVRGSKAWRPAGSILARLVKLGYVRRDAWYNDPVPVYTLTEKGKEFLTQNANK